MRYVASENKRVFGLLTNRFHTCSKVFDICSCAIEENLFTDIFGHIFVVDVELFDSASDPHTVNFDELEVPVLRDSFDDVFDIIDRPRIGHIERRAAPEGFVRRALALVDIGISARVFLSLFWIIDSASYEEILFIRPIRIVIVSEKGMNQCSQTVCIEKVGSCFHARRIGTVRVVRVKFLFGPF